MSSAFLATTIAPRIDLHLLRRDYFDGFSLLLQDADGLPFNLNEVQVCASVWSVNDSGALSQVLSINVEEQEPLSAGRIRLWLSSAQTAALWDVATTARASSQSFFPSVYANEASVATASNLIWDVRIEKEEEVADLVSVASGVFISQTNHTLASSERIVFRNTAQSSINYDGTSARVYSGLTSIAYVPPYSFTIPTLSGITDAAIGGSVYRLKQDTVVAGAVVVGTTLSNCFP
jgi:hypothetical protein